LGAFVLFKIYT